LRLPPRPLGPPLGGLLGLVVGVVDFAWSGVAVSGVRPAVVVEGEVGADLGSENGVQKMGSGR